MEDLAGYRDLFAVDLRTSHPKNEWHVGESFLVEPTGLEPVPYWLPASRSPN